MYMIGKITYNIKAYPGTHLPVKIDHQSIHQEVYGLPHVFNYYNFFWFINIVENMYKRKAQVMLIGHELSQTSTMSMTRRYCVGWEGSLGPRSHGASFLTPLGSKLSADTF